MGNVLNDVFYWTYIYSRANGLANISNTSVSVNTHTTYASNEHFVQ